MAQNNGYPDRSHLPTQPGVYIFRDAGDGVIYVGKAKNIRSRVANYFTKSGDGRPKIGELRERVRRIDFIVTKSETEALVLEANLIKRNRPRFNASLKDDKSYPYIVVTTGDEYPRVYATRATRDGRHRYFGPFPSAGSVHSTLDVLNKTFQFRKCRGPEPGRQSGVPCLNYHIGRSAAPCIGAISKPDYDAIIADVVAFLEGRVDHLIRGREVAMKEAARAMDFEKAAKLRDELTSLTYVRDRQQATIASEDSFDAFGAYAEGESACVQVFAVREGQIVNRDSFLLDNYAEAPAEAVALQFIPQFYDSGSAVPREVLVATGETDEALAPLMGHLSGLRETKVDVHRPKRGDKRRILEMAERNAKLGLAHEKLVEESQRNQVASTLDALREELALPRLPMRIECYDISNTMGTNSVASMVVFQGGRPAKDQYRRFKIKTVEGADDFSSMAEVLRRRLERLAEADEKFPAPDLVLLDGGKGQLSAVVPIFSEMGVGTELPDITLRSLAKRDEEVYEPGRPEPVLLRRDSPELHLLQRVRDEAHRFANTYHRKLRGNAMTASVLDELPGVGPARKKKILEHFGTPEAFVNASVEQLEAVPGLPYRVAREIHGRLHR